MILSFHPPPLKKVAQNPGRKSWSAPDHVLHAAWLTNNSSTIIVHVVNLFFCIHVKKNTERTVVDILFIMYKMFVDKKRTKDKYSVFDKYSLFIKNESDDSLFKTRLLTGRTMINKIQIYIKLWNINKQNSKKNAWQSTKYMVLSLIYVHWISLNVW